MSTDPPPSLLIVDDDPGAIRTIREALRCYSDVRFATNGDDAIRRVKERPPDIILLDGDMPGRHGLDVCRSLKLDVKTNDIPIIFVTAHDDPEFETRALELGAADFIGKPVSAVRVALRVKLHIKLKQQLDTERRLAAIDSLTQLANRRHADAFLDSEWKRASRSRWPLCLLLVDIDCFKQFNDAYGHQPGDACLKLVANTVRNTARRPTDLAARFGGEEFIVILADTPPLGAWEVAQSVHAGLACLREPHPTSSVAPYVTVSIGISSTHPFETAEGKVAGQIMASQVPGSSEELVRAADQALYRAKRAGRNRSEFGRVGREENQK